jgi:hypothetical protein
MNRILFWPYVRKDIQWHLEQLLDEEEQKKWIDPNYKHAFWDSLCYYVFDYLFDGPPHLFDEADKAVGISLYNQEEANTISEYLEFYYDAFEADMPDDYYINHPKWPEITEGARKIITMMEANNKKYDLDQDLKNWDKEQEERNKSFFKENNNATSS